MDIGGNTSEKLERPHILLIEDDQALLDITIQLIEHLGYSVTAVTGSDGVLSASVFDAIFQRL